MHSEVTKLDNMFLGVCALPNLPSCPCTTAPLASSVRAVLSPAAEPLISAGVDSTAHSSAHCAGAQDKKENESSNFL